MKHLILFIFSTLYWHSVCQTGGVREPWDDQAYWTLWYPIALVLAAVIGFYFRKAGWLAGPIIIFAQLPIMAINSGVGSMIVFGTLLLCLLSVPALTLSFVTGRLGDRHFNGK